VLVAVEGAAREQLDRVVAEVSHPRLPCPARKLELVVYEVAVLADPGEVPRWSLNLNTGDGEQHAGFDPDAEPAHWFVLDLAFARLHARPLSGPPPTELITDPGSEAVRRAFAAMVAWYRRNEPAGAALAQSRAGHWETTGEWASKARFQG
jgi:hypothetical protein